MRIRALDDKICLLSAHNKAMIDSWGRDCTAWQPAVSLVQLHSSICHKTSQARIYYLLLIFYCLISKMLRTLQCLLKWKPWR